MKLLDKVLRHLLPRKLAGITRDALLVLEDGRACQFGVRRTAAGLSATIEIHDPRFYRKVVLGGTVGAAEAWIEGWWSCDDPVALVRIMARALAVADGLQRGLGRLIRPLRRIWHRTRRNTRAGSQRNIRDHYDLGNGFFALWLDPTMTYSSGIYPHRDATLEEASVEKLDRICRKLGLKPEHHVLEIGTGWGSFAIHAASRYGCRVTTTTISREQHDLAVRRIEEAGLEGRIEVLLSDYRDLSGTYDRLVSIEMIEAVGHDHHATFLRKCQDLLTKDGEMLLQAITIADSRYRQAVRSVDFIQRFIFPGSCLPSVTRLCEVATRHTDLRLTHLEDITPHYVRTLADWRRRFLDRIDRVRAMGYPERFIRMWEFYLAYCEGGFAERHIGDAQFVFARPECRDSVPLPRIPISAVEPA